MIFPVPFERRHAAYGALWIAAWCCDYFAPYEHVRVIVPSEGPVRGKAVTLVNWLLLATMARYFVNNLFTALGHWDTIMKKRQILKVNPPKHQLERELDYDNSFVWSVFAFLLVKVVTPWLDIEADQIMPSSKGLGLLFAGHYGLTEPVYYLFHRYLHTPKAYKYSHSHHHASVITQGTSGTSHPHIELFGYMLNFSFPFLLPAFCGEFTYGMVIPYMMAFDALNAVGHCNFECMPLWWGTSPCKYFVYTSSFHALHHTKRVYNYTLFCPIWDYLGNTVHPRTEALFRETHAQQERKANVVLLGHGCQFDSILRMPHFSPFLASQKYTFEAWMNVFYPIVIVPAWLCVYASNKIRNVLGLPSASIVVQRWEHQKNRAISTSNNQKVQVATWTMPFSIYDYLMPRQYKSINTAIVDAIEAAIKEGATHFQLGAWNKNEALNGGGLELLPELQRRGLDDKICVVHGNTLTTAVVCNYVLKYVSPVDDLRGAPARIVLTGATGKIGKALAAVLVKAGYEVVALTRSEERFVELQAAVANFCGSDHTPLRFVGSYEEALEVPDVAAWVLGNRLPEVALAALLRRHITLLNFCVPGFDHRNLRQLRERYPECRRCTVIPAAGSLYWQDRRDTDCTVAHVGDGDCTALPSCMAAAIIHRSEGFLEHELGPVDPTVLSMWGSLAVKHGFRLGEPAEAIFDCSLKSASVDVEKLAASEDKMDVSKVLKREAMAMGTDQVRKRARVTFNVGA